MRAVGIICEYNPFHNGHKYQIERLKAEGARVVCAMSGNFTQRGEAAIIDKYKRAEMALLGGADLVVEIPFPYSCSSAEFFAFGGVSALLSAGVNEINFGSECGDIELLESAADIMLSDAFIAKRDELSGGEIGSAAAYFEAYRQISGRDADFGSNDILGIEYIKAAKKLSDDVSFSTVKREGTPYRSETLTEDEFPSASAIRARILDGGIDRLESFMPSEAVQILKNAVSDGEYSDRDRFGNALLSHLRLASPKKLADLAEMGGGLFNRLCSAAEKATDLDSFHSLASTKKYTDARIRRASIYALTGVREDDLKSQPKYFNLLGASSSGREHLATIRRDPSNRILTKPADALSLAGAERQAELSRLADAFYTLCLKAPREAGYYLKCGAVIVD